MVARRTSAAPKSKPESEEAVGRDVSRNFSEGFAWRPPSSNRVGRKSGGEGPSKRFSSEGENHGSSYHEEFA